MPTLDELLIRKKRELFVYGILSPALRTWELTATSSVYKLMTGKFSN